MDQLREAQREERRRCVLTDAAQKLSAHRWTNRGLLPPPSLLRREVEEFNRRHGLDALPPRVLRFKAGISSGMRHYEAGSSSIAPSPRTPRLTPKREEADRFEGYDLTLFSGAIGPEDFVPDDAYDTVTAMLLARSGREAEEEQARRYEAATLDDLLLEQGLDGEHAHRERMAEWDRVKAALDHIYADLCSNEE